MTDQPDNWLAAEAERRGIDVGALVEDCEIRDDEGDQL
jgi:hypothetical protein